MIKKKMQKLKKVYNTNLKNDKRVETHLRQQIRKN